MAACIKTSVTQNDIDFIIDNAQTQEHVFWDKELLVSYKLKNGFTITGRAAVVDPSKFDIEIGRKIAKEDAKKQLWLLEGYLLQQKLYEYGYFDK